MKMWKPSVGRFRKMDVCFDETDVLIKLTAFVKFQSDWDLQIRMGGFSKEKILIRIH